MFDIVPCIENINKSNKNIIFIDHANSKKMKSEHVNVKKYKNPFVKYNGQRHYIDTDYLLEMIIQKTKQRKNIKIIDNRRDDSWKKYIDRWWIKYSIHKYYMLGILFYHISEFSLSEKYYLLYIKEHAHDDLNILASCYSGLVDIFIHLNEYNICSRICQ